MSENDLKTVGAPPLTPERFADNYARLFQRTRDLLGNDPRLPAYRTMLTRLGFSQTVAGATLLGLSRAPASKNRHHAFEGGLVAHMHEMFAWWLTIKQGVMPRDDDDGAYSGLTDANVWCAIMHHDLNKVYRYKLTSQAGEPFAVDYANELDATGQLLSPATKAMYWLQHYNIPLSLHLYHALLVSEGGYSEYRTRADTVFAKVVYLLDELSANVTDRLRFLRVWDSKVSGGVDGSTW